MGRAPLHQLVFWQAIALRDPGDLGAMPIAWLAEPVLHWNGNLRHYETH